MGLGKRITWRQVGGKCYHPQPTYAWCLGTGSTIKQDVTFKVIGGGSCETAIFPLHCRLMRYRLGHKSDNGKEYGDKIGLRHTNQFTVNPGSGNGYITVRSRWRIVFFYCRVLFWFLRRLWLMSKPKYLFPHHRYLLSNNTYQQRRDA